MDLILTSLPGQFKEILSPDKLSDHDVVSETLKVYIPRKKKPRRKVYLYQKGDVQSMRKDVSDSSIPIIHYSCHITEAEGEVGIP